MKNNHIVSVVSFDDPMSQFLVFVVIFLGLVKRWKVFIDIIRVLVNNLYKKYI